MPLKDYFYYIGIVASELSWSGKKQNKKKKEKNERKLRKRESEQDAGGRGRQ